MSKIFVLLYVLTLASGEVITAEQDAGYGNAMRPVRSLAQCRALAAETEARILADFARHDEPRMFTDVRVTCAEKNPHGKKASKKGKINAQNAIADF